MFGIIDRLRTWHRRRTYRSGVTVSRFVARDVRRDVEVVDDSEVAEGYITARVRTWNVLYAARGLAEEPAFGAPQRVALESLWEPPSDSRL